MKRRAIKESKCMLLFLFNPQTTLKNFVSPPISCKRSWWNLLRGHGGISGFSIECFFFFFAKMCAFYQVNSTPNYRRKSLRCWRARSRREGRVTSPKAPFTWLFALANRVQGSCARYQGWRMEGRRNHHSHPKLRGQLHQGILAASLGAQVCCKTARFAMATVFPWQPCLYSFNTGSKSQTSDDVARNKGM